MADTIAKFIGIQSGHKFISQNIDPTLATETGAAGEAEFNWAVTLALSSILQKYGFQVQVDSANANSDPNTLTKDFDLYIAIHAESEPEGGAITAPDPSVDASNAESMRIVNALRSVYFGDSGIADNEKIITNNMTEYYMWNLLTAKTPCAIIECGALADAHDSVILADHERVALAIAHGICVAFNIAWQGDTTTVAIPLVPPVPPSPPAGTTDEACASIKLQNQELTSANRELITANQKLTNEIAALQSPATQNLIVRFFRGLLGGYPT